MHVNGSIYGIMQRDEPEYVYIPIPDQDVSHLYYDHPEIGSAIREAYYPDDITPYTLEEQAALIDRDTGKAINKAIHLFAGEEEHFAILREQIAQILTDFGQQPNEKFQRLQGIAEAEIAKGKQKKNALGE